MFKSCCEFCSIFAFDSDSGGYIPIEGIDQNDMLASVNRIANLGPLSGFESSDGILSNLFGQILAAQQRVDSVVLLKGATSVDTASLDWFCNRYRKLVRSDLMRVEVDLVGSGGASLSDNHPLDFLVSGFSDKILQFVAQRGGEGELQYIQRIDEVKRISGATDNRNNKNSNAAKTKQSISRGHTLSHGDKRPVCAPSPVGASKILKRIKARTATNSLRIFVSSTFADMHSERNLLQEIIFPAIRRRCNVSGRRVQLIDIDMRWGITQSEITADPMAAATRCLDEVLKADYLIGFVGERYGWCPPIEVFEALKIRYPTLQSMEILGNSKSSPSITAMEMHLGALSRPRHQEAIFFLRAPLSSTTEMVPLRYRKTFRDDDQGRVLVLRGQIKRVCSAMGWLCQDYGITNVVPFTPNLGKAKLDEAKIAPLIITQLWNGICRRFPSSTKIDQNQVSAVEQKLFELQQVSSVVGREDMMESLQNFVVDPNQNASCELLVVGSGGVGKSGLLAAFAHKAKTRFKKTIVLSHFCGASPSANDLRLTLQRLCLTLIRILALDMTVPTTLQQLQMTFTSLLQDVSALRSVLLIIDIPKTDGDATSVANVLQLVPRFKASNFKILCTGGKHEIEALRKRTPPPKEICVGALSEPARRLLVQTQLNKFAKRLEAHQIDAIVRKRDGGNPKYLAAVCAVLRQFSVHDTLSDDISRMPGICRALIGKIVDKWESVCSKQTTQVVFCLLTLSKFGLDEIGLAHTLSDSDIQISRMALASILARASAFLSTSSSTGVITVHPVLRECISARYLSYTGDRRDIHSLLFRNYLRVCDPMGDRQWRSKDSIAFRALHYHGLLGCQTDALLQMYRSITFLQKRCLIGDTGDLPGEYTSILENLSLTSKVQKELDDFRSFISCNMGIIKDYPELLKSLAQNQPVDSTIMHYATSSPSISWMQFVNKPETVAPGKSNVPISNNACRALTVSEKGVFIACGGDDWNVHVLLSKNLAELFCLHGHQAPIRSIAFGSTGEKTDLIVSASEDTTVRVWSLVDGTMIAGLGVQKGRRSLGHTRGVNAAEFVPSQCALVLSAGDDRTLRLWDVETEKEVGKYDKPHDAPISSVSIHPSGTMFVSGSWDGLVVVWKLEGIQCVPFAHFEAHKQAIRGVAFAPSLSKVIACCSFDGTGKVINVDSGQEICTLRGHKGPLSSVSFSKQTNTVVTCGDDGTLRVWTTVAGVPIEQLKAHSTEATSAKFAFEKTRDNYEQTVSVGVDGNIKHWIVNTEATAERDNLRGVPVTALAFVPGNRSPPKLLCGSRDGRLVSVPFSENAKVLERERSSVFWSLETLHPDGTNNQTTEPLTSIGISEDRGVFESVRSVSVSTDGEWIAIAVDETIRVFCNSTGYNYQIRIPKLESGCRVEVNYKGKGKWFKGTITGVNTTFGKCSYDIKYDDGGKERSVRKSNIRPIEGEHNFKVEDSVTIRKSYHSTDDGCSVDTAKYSGKYGKIIRFGKRNRDNAKCIINKTCEEVWLPVAALQKVTGGPSGQPICALAFHPKRPLLAWVGWDGYLNLYDVEKKVSLYQKRQTSETLKAGAKDELSGLAFGLDGKLLVAAGFSGNLYIYRLDANRSSNKSICECVSSLQAHDQWVLCCAASDVKPMIVSGGLSGIISISTADSDTHSPTWSVSQRFRGHKGHIYAIAVVTSSSCVTGDLVVSCGQDHSCRVWSPVDGPIAIFFASSPLTSLLIEPTVSNESSDQQGLPRIFCGDELGNISMLQLQMKANESVATTGLDFVLADETTAIQETKHASATKCLDDISELTYASDRLLVTLVQVGALGFAL